MLNTQFDNPTFHSLRENVSFEDEDGLPKTQKTLSRIASNIGPHIPESFITKLSEDSITHLNLHANLIQSLQLNFVTLRSTDVDNEIKKMDQLVEIDLSSNQIGLVGTGNFKAAKNGRGAIHNGPSLTIISIAPNLSSLNLSSNTLTNETLQMKIFTRGSSPMKNLMELNLSNNNLTSIPAQIAIFCPKLVTLNLCNNLIDDIRNIEYLNQCETLKEIMVESNPLCDDELYREKIICSFGNNLTRCDDEVINMEMRHRARSKLYITPKRSRQSLTKDRDISLSKLHDLETQMTKLSKLTSEQVRTTKRLLQTHAKQHVQAKSTKNESDDNIITSQSNIQLVCEAWVQTSSDYEGTHDKDCICYSTDVSSPTKKWDEKDKKYIALTLTVAFLKWSIYMVKMKVKEKKQREEENDVMKNVVKEMTEIKNSHEKKQEIYRNELQLKNYLISQMKLELRSLKEHVKQKDTELLLRHNDYTKQIERVRNEAQMNKAKVLELTKIDRDQLCDQELREAQEASNLAKERQLVISALKEEIKNKIHELDAVRQETCSLNNAMISLQKTNELLQIESRRNEVENLEKLKKAKKAMEIVTKRVAIEKIKLNKAQCTTQEAVTLAKDRKADILVLEEELRNRIHEIKIIKQEKSYLKNEIISLQKTNEYLQKKENDSLVALQDSDRTIAKYKAKIRRLNALVQHAQATQAQLHLEINGMKDKCSRLAKENCLIKKDQRLQLSKREMMMLDSQKEQKLHNKISRLKVSKKTIKEEIRKLQYIVKALHNELTFKDSRINELSQEINEIILVNESKDYKIRNDVKFTLQQMIEDKEETRFCKDKIKSLEDEISRISLEKEKIQVLASSLSQNILKERKEKNQIENHLRTVEKSLEEQCKKTEEAINSLL